MDPITNNESIIVEKSDGEISSDDEKENQLMRRESVFDIINENERKMKDNIEFMILQIVSLNKAVEDQSKKVEEALADIEGMLIRLFNTINILTPAGSPPPSPSPTPTPKPPSKRTKKEKA